MVRHPFSNKKIGIIYLKKSLAEITCLYDDTAVITLNSTCTPVNIGDFAVPFRPEPTLFDKKIDYTLCRIPEAAVTGRVLFNNLYLEFDKVLAAESNFISIDLGNGLVSKGTFLLFYRKLYRTFPPLILGTGIVIHSENTNSTVKVLDTSIPIETGDFAVIISESKKDEKKAIEEEKIPIVETLKKEAENLPKGEKMEVDILFDSESKEINPDVSRQFEEIQKFIANNVDYTIIIRGYISSNNPDEATLKLTQGRIENVKNLLINQYKLKNELIETYYYAEKDAPTDNKLIKIEVMKK